MKKMIVAMMLLTMILTSCLETSDIEASYAENSSGEQPLIETEQQREATIVDSYEALLSAPENGDDIYTGEYFYDDLLNIERKSDMPAISVNLFGREDSLHYSSTTQYLDGGYQLDRYTKVVSRYYVSVAYLSDTEKLVHYSASAEKGQSYSSPVTPDSTEEEYIAYAKQILLDYTGLSTEKWGVKTSTFSKYKGREDLFVNYDAEKFPGNDTEYTITFYKEICGIERSDKVFVRMTNYGEILEFSAINCDSAFAPFERIAIDGKKVEKTALGVAQRSVDKHVETWDIKDSKLHVKNDALWVLVGFQYSYIDNLEEYYQTVPDGTSSSEPVIERGTLEVAVKVAELLP